ncbi:MAG: HAMP domain-containing protein [Betaproteobacteria bacterium]|nr:HAMP domain-containing protein [Betaproteobacteria bacterium]
MKRWGIRTRVLLLALLPAVLIAVVLAGYMVYRVAADADRELVAYGRGLSRQLAAVSEFSAYSGDRAALGIIAAAALDETHITAVAIFDADGVPVANSGPPPARLSPLPPGRQPSLLGSDENSLFFAAPIVLQRAQIGDLLFAESSASERQREAATLGWVTLRMSRSATRQRKREAVFIALFSTFVVSVFAGALAMALGRQVTQPILRLEGAVARIQEGNLDVRVPADSGGDLQRLEDGMNSMVAALGENREFLQARIAAATTELEQKKSEAERANVAKSRFLAAASHDLRQPLHALSLFAADLGHEAVTPAQQRLSRQINESVSNISELLDALLDISRLDLADIVPQKTCFPVGEVFAQLESGYSRLAGARGLRFRCRPTHLAVWADPALLVRLLGNLVSNAIAYTASGGVLVAARRRGDGVHIEVRDSGVGIAPEYQQVIFEEFFQVGNAGRVRNQGLGLGLAIVKRLAGIQGLKVAVRSAPWLGSVFSVVLPPAPAPASGSPAALPASGPAPVSRRLALLRPQTPQLVEVAALAERWGIAVVWADSCEECIGIAGSGVSGKGAVTVVAGMQEGLAQSILERAAECGTALVLLGNAATPRPATAHVLSLPLRPARLRALLGRLMSIA